MFGLINRFYQTVWTSGHLCLSYIHSSLFSTVVSVRLFISYFCLTFEKEQGRYCVEKPTDERTEETQWNCEKCQIIRH